MIYVDGVPFSPDSSQGVDTLTALMKHPALVSASKIFKSISERKISFGESSCSDIPKNCKWVYLFQREFATVDPELVDVHLVGGFEDISSQHSYHSTKSHAKLEGYSYPLCAKIVESLSNRREKFEIQTLHVLGHNTRWDSEGIANPIFHGFVVETNKGSIVPASFDRTSRCPDEVVRRIRVTACFEDPNWTNRLLETYDTESDRFVIAPCAWTNWQSRVALTYRHLSDTEILLACSSSPSAEGPDFVDNLKSMWDYLIRQPDWRETFPSKKARVFQRNADKSWVKR